MAVGVCVVLGLWTLLSLLAQFPPGARRVKGIWNFFLPHWSLFTAPLIFMDMRLYYREQIAPGLFTEWQPAPNPLRPWTESIWQPRRRFGKWVGDIAVKLVGLRRAGGRSVAPSTTPYRLLHNYLRQNLPSQRPIQFGLMAGCGVPSDMPKMVFLSDVHDS
jgi:hypothetical protein